MVSTVWNRCVFSCTTCLYHWTPTRCFKKSKICLSHCSNFAFDVLIPADHAPTAAFWAQYNDEERSIGMWACLLIWTVTDFKHVPREFQLDTTIAIMTRKDSLVDVDTGYGKTLFSCLKNLFRYPQYLIFELSSKSSIMSKGLRRLSRKMLRASWICCSRDFGALRGSHAERSIVRRGYSKVFTGRLWFQIFECNWTIDKIHSTLKKNTRMNRPELIKITTVHFTDSFLLSPS